ncbi:Carbohydrate esterase family 4 protein [Mycena venus]|uniref:Carbohydrate esterase family 4 protein n=1 Tax=Mycena venus TaxID=2733690 RepID=A0A8H6YKM9_9AGAR|nr:Carbohydrate esterase family 4 protein [Mycena venus]
MHTAISLLALAGLGYASILSALDGTSAKLFTGCVTKGDAALTFDDGPYLWNKNVSDICAANGAKVTFFLNAYNWDCMYQSWYNVNYTDSLLYALSKEHQLASHTYSHKDMTTLNQTTLDREIDWNNLAIKRMTGCMPAFLRPPYGSYNDTVLMEIGKRNMTACLWDFDSQDSWTGANATNSKKAYDQGVSSAQGSMLALNHETYSNSSPDFTVFDVLPYAIDLIQSYGFNLVTVAECLGQKPYLSTGPPSKRDWTWYCQES